MMRYADTQFGGWIFLSIMPGYSMSPRLRRSRWRNGTTLLPLTCRRCFTPADWRCLQCAKNWGRIINIASVHGLVASKEVSLCRCQAWGGRFYKIRRWRLPAPVLPLTPSARDGCLRRWFSSRSTNVSQKVCLRIGRASSCLRRNSHQESLLRQNSWVNWRCFM